MTQNLGRLATDLGERSSYDAASQCSRCGYCEQACPTYVATGREAQSGRGRNQIVRLMLEGKLDDPAAAAEALSTCLLCGACTSACYAHVPTAEIVLEGRRMLRGKPSWPARLVFDLLLNNSGRLARLLKAAFALKRLGLARLARPWLRWLGYEGLAVAEAHAPRPPRRFLSEELSGMPSSAASAWHYFSACGPNYLFPQVGLATVKALGKGLGKGGFLQNPCCGLLAYNYGDLADARVLARRNIERLESLGGQGPVVGDCSSCVAFLKGYPQLFLEEPDWLARARAFAARVKDAVELYAEMEIAPVSNPPPVVAYHDSCRARHGQGVWEAPRQALRKLFGASYRELPEADVCCGGAGAFGFTHPELSDEVLRRKISRIAAIQARLVVTSSTSCLLQLAQGLSKYYPEAKVVHLSELIAATPEKP